MSLAPLLGRLTLAPMIERYVVPLAVVVPSIILVISAGFKIAPDSAMGVALGSLGVGIAGYLTRLAEKKASP